MHNVQPLRYIHKLMIPFQIEAVVSTFNDNGDFFIGISKYPKVWYRAHPESRDSSTVFVRVSYRRVHLFSEESYSGTDEYYFEGAQNNNQSYPNAV